MNFITLVMPLLLGFEPEPRLPGPIYEATGQDPYFLGKTGFRTASRAVDHAVREFRGAARRGALNPSRDEFFSFIYTFQDPGGRRRVFFHSQWRMGEFEKSEAGSLRHLVRSPVAETAAVRVYTFIHTHPTSLRDGEGPSRVDVATASRYKRPDGSFRYLYLINNRGKLVRFKARRDIDPNDPIALGKMPVKPRMWVDWVD